MNDTRDSPHGLDDLLRPSVQPSPATTARPWRLGSQFYVAFFGGALGVTIIALLNGARLALPVAQRWAIAGLGVLGLAASALVISAVGLDEDGSPRTARVLGQVCGVAAWGGMYLIQRSADRIHEYRCPDDQPYASLWGSGIAASVAGGAVQVLLTLALIDEAA